MDLFLLPVISCRTSQVSFLLMSFRVTLVHCRRSRPLPWLQIPSREWQLPNWSLWRLLFWALHSQVQGMSILSTTPNALLVSLLCPSFVQTHCPSLERLWQPERSFCLSSHQCLLLFAAKVIIFMCKSDSIPCLCKTLQRLVLTPGIKSHSLTWLLGCKWSDSQSYLQHPVFSHVLELTKFLSISEPSYILLPCQVCCFYPLIWTLTLWHLTKLLLNVCEIIHFLSISPTEMSLKAGVISLLLNLYP